MRSARWGPAVERQPRKELAAYANENAALLASEGVVAAPGNDRIKHWPAFARMQRQRQAHRANPGEGTRPRQAASKRTSRQSSTSSSGGAVGRKAVVRVSSQT